METAPKQNKGCLIFSIIVAGLFLWWAFSPSDADAKADNEAAERVKVVREAARHADSLERLPIEAKVANAYDDLNSGVFTDAKNIENFQTLTAAAKGTKHESQARKTLDSLTFISEKKENERQIAERKEFETTLRNSFLDNNLDIEVKVSGKENRNIKLSYALFNDVWFRKFETEGHFETLYQKGFRKITLTDNYDYNKYMQYE